jgi:FkbM family methyltransferase
MLGAFVEALLVKTDNGMFLVDPEDLTVGRKLAFSGQYGFDELHRLEMVMQPKTRALVVGTHVGALAIAASKRCAQLTAIEANPKTFRLLEMNLLINGCRNVKAINIAASDKREDIQFVLSRANSGGSKRLPVVHDFAYFYDSPAVVTVPAAPLDEILEGESFDVILMDVEGSEYFALRGMPSILAGARDLFVEFIPHHLKNVSCVSVEDFLSTISSYFSRLYIPSQNLHVEREDFLTALQVMYDTGRSDDGLHFAK